MIISMDAAYGLRFEHFQSRTLKSLQWEGRLQPKLSWLQIFARGVTLTAISAVACWLAAL